MSPDDRIWRPDLLAVLDWEVVWDGTQARYSDQPEATWWAQATAGVNYYRADMPAKHLPGKTVRFDNGDLRERDDGSMFFPRQEGDAAIWLFPGNVTKWVAMAHMKTGFGFRVLVEVDDNYTVSPPTGGSWLSHRDETGGDHASYEAHVKIVQSAACDGVIVSTPKLAEVYGRLHENVWVCPNSVDPADWPAEEPEHQPDGVLRVGWAGSASHAYDLADIRPALDWAWRQPDVEVVFLGELPPGFISVCQTPWAGVTASYRQGFSARQVGWTDSLAQYRKNVEQIDVMLCPLRPNAWQDCKSDVKALEAAMGGACSVVSRTEPYRSWWDGDAPGYVADSPKDFVKVVKHLIAHRDEVRETARLAREYALTKRNISESIDSWREAIAG